MLGRLRRDPSVRRRDPLRQLGPVIPIGALGHPSFRRLWAAETMSLLGTQVSVLAVPSLAILLTGATAGEVAFLYALGYLPAVVLSLPLGLLVDRFDRRRVMILADVGRIFTLTTLPFGWFVLGDVAIPHLYAVAIILGLGGTLYDLASQSSLSAIVDEPTLADANAKLAMSQSLSQTVGAPIAGALVQLVGGILAVLVDAISYCISAALIKSLPPWDRPRPRAPEGGGHRGIASGVFEGVRILAGDEHLRRTAGIMAVLNLGGSIVGALFLVFTYRTLMLDPATVGVILAVGSLGGLAASIVAPRIQRALGVTQTIRVSALGASTALWLIPASAIGLAPLVLILYEAAFSFSATVFWICQVTLRQQRVASEVQGRTHAAVRVIALGTLPVGAFIGGIAASTLEVSNAIVLGCAAAFAGCVLLSLRWPGTQDGHQSLLHS